MQAMNKLSKRIPPLDDTLYRFVLIEIDKNLVTVI